MRVKGPFEGTEGRKQGLIWDRKDLECSFLYDAAYSLVEILNQGVKCPELDLEQSNLVSN